MFGAIPPRVGVVKLLTEPFTFQPGSVSRVSTTVIGLIAGFIARAVVPGRDSMSIGGTILLGIVGSFIGGFIGYVLTHHDAYDAHLFAIHPDTLSILTSPAITSTAIGLGTSVLAAKHKKPHREALAWRFELTQSKWRTKFD